MPNTATNGKQRATQQSGNSAIGSMGAIMRRSNCVGALMRQACPGGL